jgi:hypothetical protein
MTAGVMVELLKVALKQLCKAVCHRDMTLQQEHPVVTKQHAENSFKHLQEYLHRTLTNLTAFVFPRLFSTEGCWLMQINLLEKIHVVGYTHRLVTVTLPIHVGYTHRLVTLTLPIPTGLLRPEIWPGNVD